MTIYIDVIFIENVIMNLSIVLSESIILNLKTGFLRKLIASIIGTLFYLLQLFFSVRYLQIIISLLVIWIAFKPNKITLIFLAVISRDGAPCHLMNLIITSTEIFCTT